MKIRARSTRGAAIPLPLALPIFVRTDEGQTEFIRVEIWRRSAVGKLKAERQAYAVLAGTDDGAVPMTMLNLKTALSQETKLRRAKF